MKGLLKEDPVYVRGEIFLTIQLNYSNKSNRLSFNYLSLDRIKNSHSLKKITNLNRSGKNLSVFYSD